MFDKYMLGKLLTIVLMHQPAESNRFSTCQNLQAGLAFIRTDAVVITSASFVLKMA